MALSDWVPFLYLKADSRKRFIWKKWKRVVRIMTNSKNRVTGIYAWVVKGVVRYVGSSKDIYNSRKSNHLSRLRNGTHIPQLQQLFDEFGQNAFEFVELERCLVRELNEREDHYKDVFKDTIFNLNDINNYKKDIKTGLRAKSFKDKLSEVNSGTGNPMCKTETTTIVQIKVALRDGKMTNKQISDLFGKSPSMISSIKNNKRWAKLEIPLDYQVDNKLHNNEVVSEEIEHTKNTEKIKLDESLVLCQA